METIIAAEQEFDQILDQIEEVQHQLYRNDIRYIRRQLESVFSANSALSMINVSKQGIDQCIRYWDQTPSEHTTLQTKLKTLSDLLDTVWQERKSLAPEIKDLEVRIKQKITDFLERIIDEEEVTNPINGGRMYKAKSRRGRRRSRQRPRGRRKK